MPKQKIEIPYLPKAKRVDLQYRSKLFKLASSFVNVYDKSKWYQFNKRKLCIGSIINIYNALK